MSDDGQNAITIIGFVGSVFSPYYAFARRKGAADPLNHCALNVAVYRKGANRWAMTERPRHAVSRATDHLRIGPSAMHWDGIALTIDINEVTVPFPGKIRGTIRVMPSALTAQTFTLNQTGNHRWWPIAPCARVQVALKQQYLQPDLRWQGDGYFDMNSGDAPIEDGFTDWQWARGSLRDGTAIMYDAVRRDGSRTELAVAIDPSGAIRKVAPPGHVPLQRTGWLLDRSVRSDEPAHVVRTLEDAPFYARSLVSAHLLGEPVTMIHESLALNRFRRPIVQAMLPFRMPRARS